MWQRLNFRLSNDPIIGNLKPSYLYLNGDHECHSRTTWINTL